MRDELIDDDHYPFNDLHSGTLPTAWLRQFSDTRGLLANTHETPVPAVCRPTRP